MYDLSAYIVTELTECFLKGSININVTFSVLTLLVGDKKGLWTK